MGSKSKNKNDKAKANAADGPHGGGKIITDPRFAAVHSDPRFREAPKHKAKVAIDSRFNRMFTDKNFANSKARIDKRGKPRMGADESHLKHYYRLEEEEKAKERKRMEELMREEAENESQSEDGDEESEKESGEDEENVKLNKVGLAVKSRSESESESESDDDEEEEESDDLSTSTSDTDEEDMVYEEEEDTFLPEENVPEIDKETHRIAVVNMDWSKVKAVDLLVLLSSFLPKTGQILSVAVYPSDFGLKRMEEEAVHGPVGLFDADKKNKREGGDDDDDEDDEEIDNEKLRSYELSRLRYYYAVVECDSTATADYLYKTCDGVEFERTSNKLDLRFIPDSMEFKHEPRDVATEAPLHYEGVDFHTRALQHSNIELTWDEDEPHRARTLKRKFDADQLAELELKEFLASDESESDDDDHEKGSIKKRRKQDMYRALLQSGDGSDGNDEEDQDMEVTFNTGLEDLSKRILEKKDKKSETVWEAYLSKRREKKKARKYRSKNSSSDESSDTDQEPAEQPDDFFDEEPSDEETKEAQHKKALKRNQNKEREKEDEASRAELELLLADDNESNNLKGYNMKPKKSKSKKGKEIPDEGKIPTMDYEDQRFSALFKSPLFALDPTDPQFKRSAAYVRQVAQKQQKGDDGNTLAKEQLEEAGSSPLSKKPETSGNENLQLDGGSSQKDKHELSSLVRSIKMKSKQVSLPSQSGAAGKNGKLQLKERRRKVRG